MLALGININFQINLKKIGRDNQTRPIHEIIKKPNN